MNRLTIENKKANRDGAKLQYLIYREIFDSFKRGHISLKSLQFICGIESNSQLKIELKEAKRRFNGMKTGTNKALSIGVER